MKISDHENFMDFEDLADTLSNTFKDQYSEKYASSLVKGIPPLETQKNFCKKQGDLFNQGMNAIQENLLQGLLAFIKRDSPEFSTPPLFKNFLKLIETSREETAEKTTQEILEIADEDYIQLYNLAVEELNQKNYEEASPMFFLLAWLNPFVYHALLHFAFTESQQGRYEEAKSIYEDYLPSLPKDPLVHLYAANNFRLLGDTRKAQELLNHAKGLADFDENSAYVDMAQQIQEKL